jgi:transposase InsO family protein
VGKPVVGYSLDITGKKVCDDEIKELIIKGIEEDAFAYGYRKLKHFLGREYGIILNHKKVYRLCKELDVLKPQRKIKPKGNRHIAINRIIKRSNELWEMDIKYGYIQGEDKFFFVLAMIDVFDRCIVDYYIGLRCEGSDAAMLIRRGLMKRGLFETVDKPVIRTDNGPQFISCIFEHTCLEINMHHERIPCRTPNKNAHIESFNKILQDECIGINEFDNYMGAYESVSDFMKRYNKRRIHSSLKYKTPEEFYNLFNGSEVDGMIVKL